MKKMTRSMVALAAFASLSSGAYAADYPLKDKVTPVPYKGTGPAMTDLIGGQIDIMCDQTTNTSSVSDKRVEPAEHKKFVAAEIAKFSPVIKAAGVYAD